MIQSIYTYIRNQNQAKDSIINKIVYLQSDFRMTFDIYMIILSKIQSTILLTDHEIQTLSKYSENLYKLIHNCSYIYS